MPKYDRRTIIRGTGIALAGALAGCSGGESETETETATETATATATETATETVTATETPTSADYMAGYRQAITEELDIDIVSLEMNGPTVEIVYETSYEANTSESGGQIGYLAGAYAGLVDEGWDTDALRAEFTDGEGVEYRFEIESSVAQNYIDGDITEDEFITAIFNSLTRIDGSN